MRATSIAIGSSVRRRLMVLMVVIITGVWWRNVDPFLLPLTDWTGEHRSRTVSSGGPAKPCPNSLHPRRRCSLFHFLEFRICIEQKFLSLKISFLFSLSLSLCNYASVCIYIRFSNSIVDQGRRRVED